jgi:hypothetical protein
VMDIDVVAAYNMEEEAVMETMDFDLVMAPNKQDEHDDEILHELA